MLEDESLEAQNEGFRSIVDAMLDPAVEMCLTVSEEKQKVRPRWDKQVFVLNCLSYLKVCSIFRMVVLCHTFYQSVIEPFLFTAEKQEFLDQLIEGKVLSLIEDHVSALFLPRFAAKTFLY